MATETRTTTEREESPIGSDDAVSDERTLGRLEGQVSILLRNVEEQRRQSREDYRLLSAKIDSVNTGLSDKIDSVNTGLDAKIDSVNAALNDKIDNVNTALSARIDRLFYWMLGLCVAIIITIIGSAIGLAIRLG